MSVRRFALCCNTLAILLFVLMGLVYGLTPRPLPYHLQILGTDWNQIAPASRLLLMALLHGAGLATLSAATGLLLILWIPWRRAERWARLAVPLLGGTTCALLTLLTWRLQVTTGLPTPWKLLAVPLLLLLVAAIIDKISNKNN